MPLRDWSIRRTALFVGHHLREQGVEAVLTGGACVSIYSRNAYPSFDLDFVLLASDDRKAAARAVEGLGFRREGRHFRHPETPFLVEFLLPPLSIGAEPVRRPAEIRAGRRILKLLSPTDCVKDRLAAFYFWDDRLSLDQAAGVAARQPIDARDVRRWSEREGMSAKYEVFVKALSARRRRGKKKEKP